MNLLRVWLPLAGLITLTALAGEPAALVPAGQIALPGVRGRIDHLALDHAGQRLFVAALGNNSVEVVDLANHRIMRSIDGFDEPQGIAYAPDLNRLFVANGGDGSVRVLNAAYFGELASIPLSSDADNVRYDAATRQVIVGYDDGALAILDATANRVLWQAALPSHPESFQLESGEHRIFVNVPGARQLVVVDRATRRVTASWRLTASGNFPLALDEAGKRLIVACRSPGRLLVLSTVDGHELAQAPLHGDCDDVFFDSARQRIYASCGEGMIDVFASDPAKPFDRVETVTTVSGARTCLFDGDRLYLAVPKHGDTPAEIRLYAVK